MERVQSNGQNKQKKGAHRTMPNLGENKAMAVDSDWLARHMGSQVCDVHKPLLSVSKIAQTRIKVVFSKMGNCVEDNSSGEEMYMIEARGMYLLKPWQSLCRGGCINYKTSHQKWVQSEP